MPYVDKHSTIKWIETTGMVKKKLNKILRMETELALKYNG